MKEVVELLQQYGGWATTAFIAYAMVMLYKDFKNTIQKKDEIILQLNEEHNKEIVAVVRECTAIMTTVKDELQECHKGNNNESRNQ